MKDKYYNIKSIDPNKEYNFISIRPYKIKFGYKELSFIIMVLRSKIDYYRSLLDYEDLTDEEEQHLIDDIKMCEKLMSRLYHATK